jgi:hypothetical protein
MNPPFNSEYQENVTFDELFVGQSKRLFRTLSLDDIKAFAAVSGDTNPAHLDAEYANDTLMHGVVAHGMWGPRSFRPCWAPNSLALALFTRTRHCTLCALCVWVTPLQWWPPCCQRTMRKST